MFQLIGLLTMNSMLQIKKEKKSKDISYKDKIYKIRSQIYDQANEEKKIDSKYTSGKYKSKKLFYTGQKTGKRELHVKKILEAIFYPLKWVKIRPNWLKNPDTGRNLEIDLYCLETKI